MNDLVSINGSQGALSRAAGRLKTTYNLARATAFSLSIAGALLAAVASQLSEPARIWTAGAAAVAFAFVTFVTGQFLGGVRAQQWVRARGASESLKRLAYTAAASAAPYAGPMASPGLLQSEKVRIENAVEDVLSPITTGPKGSTPVDPISETDYVKDRVDGQIAFYSKEANAAIEMATRFRWIQLVLAGVTTLITALLGATPKYILTTVNFDFVALTTVVTTIAGLVLSYVEAARYDFLAMSYGATARRLSEVTLPPGVDATKPEWSQYVNACEDVLEAEHAGWIAKFSGQQKAVASH
jgi:SMODS and SLOG-associating 2TM effector domain 1/Protein of unknown function (DUF4231)